MMWCEKTEAGRDRQHRNTSGEYSSAFSMFVRWAGFRHNAASAF